MLGRDFIAGEDAAGAAPVAIIGHRVWKNRYASDPNIVGRTIAVNDVAYTIVGVMPEGMRFPIAADLWRPLLPPTDLEAARNRNTNAFGRLGPERHVDASGGGNGDDLTRAAKHLSGDEQDHRRAADDVQRALQRWADPTRAVHAARRRWLVLLIACANVANLLLARSAFRAREMAVRTALGATRWRIIRQLLIESVMLACIGGICGLGLAAVGVRAFDAAVASIDKPYWIRFDFDWSVLGYFAAICVATGVIFGLAPAFQVSRTNLNELMKESGRGTAGGTRTRWLTSTLVVVEISLALALLTGAGLMTRSFLALYALELGIDPGHLLTMRTQLLQRKYPTAEQRYQFYETLQSRLAQIPGVTAVAVTTSLPSQEAGSYPYEIEGQPSDSPERRPRVTVVDIGARYFDTLGTSVRRGRSIQPQDGMAGSEVVVISERLAAQFRHGEDPIGRRIRVFSGRETTPEAWATIVGIAPTIMQGSVRDLEPSAVMYRPYRQNPGGGLAFLVRTEGEPTLATNAVRQTLQRVDPDQPVFAVRTLEEVVAEPRYPFAVFGTLFVIFGAIGLAMSAVGIYAVTAYSVTQRTQEIGVRMALGARPGQIAWMILRSGVVYLSIGLSIGLLAAYGVSQVLANIVVRVSTTDPLTFASITLLLILVTIVACLVPARRATRMDPLTALRID